MENAEFEKRLKELNLSKKDFTHIVNIPYQTLMNWKLKGKTPAWTGPLLFYYEKSRSFDIIMDSIKKFTT